MKGEGLPLSQLSLLSDRLLQHLVVALQKHVVLRVKLPELRSAALQVQLTLLQLRAQLLQRRLHVLPDQTDAAQSFNSLSDPQFRAQHKKPTLLSRDRILNG